LRPVDTHRRPTFVLSAALDPKPSFAKGNKIWVARALGTLQLNPMHLLTHPCATRRRKTVGRFGFAAVAPQQQPLFRAPQSENSAIVPLRLLLRGLLARTRAESQSRDD
jgi:hypothetical protein